MKYINYLKYLLKHKWYVFLACVEYGIIWRGLIHDLSKFLPSEFFPYAEYFYGKGNNKMEFDFAWLLHQKRNPHHWQWWISILEDGTKQMFGMSSDFRTEMLCDWFGCGMAKGKPDILEWYMKHKDEILLHSKTRYWIEKELKIR